MSDILKRIKNRILYIFCIFLGLMILFEGTYILYNSVKFKKNTETTTGYLIDYYKKYSEDIGIENTNLMWSGIYEFNVNSKTYICKSSYSHTSIDLIKNEVDIDYDKSNPSINRISIDIRKSSFCILFGIIFSWASAILAKNHID